MAKKMKMSEMKVKVTKISHEEMGLKSDEAKKGTGLRKTSVQKGKEVRR